MTTTTEVACPACKHPNPPGAKFCNSCGKPLPAMEYAAGHGGGGVKVPVSALPAKPGAHHDEAFYHTNKFYGWVFVILAIITVVEIFTTRQGPTAFWVPFLIVLSTIKFALVAMFFMHLFGDKRFLQLLFVGPLMIGLFLAVTIGGLFRNF